MNYIKKKARKPVATPYAFFIHTWKFLAWLFFFLFFFFFAHAALLRKMSNIFVPNKFFLSCKKTEIVGSFVLFISCRLPKQFKPYTYTHTHTDEEELMLFNQAILEASIHVKKTATAAVVLNCLAKEIIQFVCFIFPTFYTFGLFILKM